ncbi:MAG: HAD-IA family hydrolase [Myxococcota bacterium]|jgi:phosphoglycolate phosphatase|nr:HAD-IA family hydrolase [Myxococcota bacterium]
MTKLSSTTSGAFTCVVFDLDGTLVDSRVDIAASINHGLMSVGHEPKPVEQIQPFIGQPLVQIFETLLGPSQKRAQDAATAYRSHYFDHCADHSRLYPGIEELLDALCHVPLGIATTKMTFMAVEVARRLGIDRRFAVVQGCDGIPHKPDPAVVHLTLQALGQGPSGGWMVGDTHLDIEAGRAAGLATCAVTWGFGAREELRRSRPNLMVDSPVELAVHFGVEGPQVNPS